MRQTAPIRNILAIPAAGSAVERLRIVAESVMRGVAAVEHLAGAIDLELEAIGKIGS